MPAGRAGAGRWGGVGRGGWGGERAGGEQHRGCVLAHAISGPVECVGGGHAGGGSAWTGRAWALECLRLACGGRQAAWAVRGPGRHARRPRLDGGGWPPLQSVGRLLVVLSLGALARVLDGVLEPGGMWAFSISAGGCLAGGCLHVSEVILKTFKLR